MATRSFSLLLLFSLLIFALMISVDAAEPEEVLDMDGDIVRSSGEYYILPMIWGSGGGLSLAPSRHGLCPLDVVQSPWHAFDGVPTTFSPVLNSEKEVIPVSENVNIMFSTLTPCRQSTMWKVAYDKSYSQYFVTTGGKEASNSSFFKIERFSETNNFYKISSCPTDFGKPICTDVSTREVDGVRRLTLSDRQPFYVVFKKA